MSIFTKDCPICTASHPVHAVRCGCGHCFDPNKLDGVTQELEVISQEEKLYSDYLAARAEQAEAAMHAAKAAAAVDPGNKIKTADALLAEQNARSARAEYEAQSSRAQAIKSRVKVVRASRRSRRIAKATGEPATKKVASVREALAPPRPAPAPVIPAAPPARVRTMEPVQKQISNPAPVRITPTPAVLTSRSTAPAAALRPANNRQPAVVAPAPKAAPSPVVRIAQQVPAEPPAFDKPTPAFRASQALRVEEMKASVTQRSPECPNCSAAVKPGATRCGCGFELTPSANQMPSLSLSPEEREAFLAVLGPGTGSRR